MGKQTRMEQPTPNFPYKISRRLNVLSTPRKSFMDTSGGPSYTKSGIRKSALNGQPSDRVNDIAWPWLRRLMIVKKMYKNKFSQERLDKLDRIIEASNGTLYSKLANCVIDLKQNAKELKKKKTWTESEWKKHMDYIGAVAVPKKEFKPPPVKRGISMPLEALLPRINVISSPTDFKCYRRMSKEIWYRDPIKVQPAALKYEISDRVKMLAAPRNIPAP